MKEVRVDEVKLLGIRRSLLHLPVLMHGVSTWRMLSKARPAATAGVLVVSGINMEGGGESPANIWARYHGGKFQQLQILSKTAVSEEKGKVIAPAVLYETHQSAIVMSRNLFHTPSCVDRYREAYGLLSCPRR